jgi:serine/threonine-protein kinase RsbW
MQANSTTLTIPNDPSYLPIVGAYVRAAAGRFGMDDADADDVHLAVEEGCLHIIETAFAPGEAQAIAVSCERSPSGLLVTIADQGLPFDPGSIPHYDARGGLDRDLRGLPFHLIQQLMDQVQFVNKGWKGKELRLVKYVKVPNVEAYFPEDELRPYDAAVTPAPPGKIDYRLAEPKDAIEIARCVYKTYGYEYPSEHVYFPERLAAMNQSGQLISAVAVTETGEVIGHCALSRDHADDPLAEVGQAVVNPAYRNRGVLTGLDGTLLMEALRRALGAFYAQARTLHPYSQKASLKSGFRETAILLARYPGGVLTKGIADPDAPGREAVVYAYVSLRAEPRGLVFAPAHHRPMLERIYGNAGLKRLFAPIPAGTPAIGAGGAPAALATAVVPHVQYATVEVTGYGPGIVQQVRGRLRELCHKGIAAVYLHLPLGDPQTAVLCKEFEDLGFFFAGVLPRPAQDAGQEDLPVQDRLCLQLVNGPAVDYDWLKIYSDFWRELLAYIRERDPRG